MDESAPAVPDWRWESDDVTCALGQDDPASRNELVLSRRPGTDETVIVVYDARREPRAASSAVIDRPQVAELEPPRLVSSDNVSPYPEAVNVGLFVRAELEPGEVRFLQPDGRRLTSVERTAFENALVSETWTEGYGGEEAACFIPHHFFRYFDATGQQIGEVAVCLCCHGVEASPNLRLEVVEGGDYVKLEFDEASMRDLIEGMGLPVNINCD